MILLEQNLSCAAARARFPMARRADSSLSRSMA
jgi:hypothetical protein